MKVIVGLGNPGEAYRDTRHNAGFRVLDRFAEDLSAGVFAPGHKGVFSRVALAGHDVLLLKPRTFMNNSGDAVTSLLDAGVVNEEECQDALLVVTDDVALPLGRLRLRALGSSGGHNGLASVEQSLASSAYPRLRIGVGPGPEEEDLAAFVLSAFEEEEEEILTSVIPTAAKLLSDWVVHGLEVCQQKYNGWSPNGNMEE